MSTISYAITTLAKIKSYRGISVATYDTLIENLIAGVTDFIEHYTGKRFLEADYTEELDIPNGNIILLKNYPVVSLTSVKYQSGTPSVPIWNAFDANSYQLYREEGYIKFFANFSENNLSPRYLQVVYKAGYKIDFTKEFDPLFHTLPHDISLVATELVAKAFDQRFAQGKEAESVEGASIDWSFLLTEEQKEILLYHQKLS